MRDRSHLRNSGLHLAAIVAVAAVLEFASFSHASAYTLHRPHSFCAENNCHDGKGPGGRLVSDTSGDLYGATYDGGLSYSGTVYELVPNALRTKWAYHRLHSFCEDQVSCKDGWAPNGGLIIDAAGNLYGTTMRGGSNHNGVIYELSKTANGWTYRTIYNFTGIGGNSVPSTGLAYYGQQLGAPWDGSSPLFGTTDKDVYGKGGIVYVLNHDGDTWNVSVIHQFSSGSFPQALLVDSSFNLFGETRGGGKYGAGTLYELKAGSWKETTLHAFCSSANCADGNDPIGGLVLDAAGNLYGVTYNGGSNCQSNQFPGCGVAFRRTADGTFSVIYNFCSDTTACHDGSAPNSLVIDASGNLYGTAYYGGFSGNNGGVVFQLYPGVVSVLYSFCSQNPPNCTDGKSPYAPLLEDGAGNLFGVTESGGVHDPSGGEVFELKP